MLQNQSVTYTFRQNPRARHLRLTVWRDGSVVVTAPRGFAEARMEDFIREKLYRQIRTK